MVWVVEYYSARVAEDTEEPPRALTEGEKPICKGWVPWDSHCVILWKRLSREDGKEIGEGTAD